MKIRVYVNHNGLHFRNFFFFFLMKNFDLVKRILKFSLLYIFRYKFARKYLLITRS